MDLNTFLDAVTNGENWNREEEGPLHIDCRFPPIGPDPLPEENTVTETITNPAVTLIRELEEKLDDALAEATDLSDKLTVANKTAGTNYGNLVTKSAELREFKRIVRDAIIDLVDQNTLNEEDAEELLTGTLGLDGLEKEFECEVHISQNVLVRIKARNEDDAREKVDEMDSDDILSEADQWGWDIETTSYINEI